MPRITNAGLQDQLESLRTHCDRLETTLASVTRERDVAVDGLHRIKGELLAARLPTPQYIDTRVERPVRTWRDASGHLWGKFYVNGVNSRVATLRRLDTQH